MGYRIDSYLHFKAEAKWLQLPILTIFCKFCALMAYAHINTLWPSIQGCVLQNLSFFYPVYVSSSIIYASSLGSQLFNITQENGRVW